MRSFCECGVARKAMLVSRTIQDELFLRFGFALTLARIVDPGINPPNQRHHQYDAQLSNNQSVIIFVSYFIKTKHSRPTIKK